MPKMSKKNQNLNQPRPPRTIQELKTAAHHLRYEREMLEFTGARLTGNPHPINLDYAVLMESFLIHARNLNEFFYGLEMDSKGKRLRLNDVIAEDFFDPQIPWVKPQDKRLPDTPRQQINDQLAHLTYAREVGKYDDWDFQDIRQRMNGLVDSFFQAVAPDKVEPLAFTPMSYFV